MDNRTKAGSYIFFLWTHREGEDWRCVCEGGRGLINKGNEWMKRSIEMKDQPARRRADAGIDVEDVYVHIQGVEKVYSTQQV